MRLMILILPVFFLQSTSSLADTMHPLDDSELSAISGQQGIELTLRLRNNMDENNNPLSCSGSLNPCRMGIEFANYQGT